MTELEQIDLIERIDAAFADPEAAARAHKAAGGCVIAYLGATVPVEMIAASGAFPLRLKGGHAQQFPLADTLMEPVRELYLRRIFDRMLAGEMEWIDLLIIPRSSEGLLQFYYLLEYARNYKSVERLPKIVLLDLLQTPFPYTQVYNLDRLRELNTAIETVTGTKISSDALTQQIVAYNNARADFRTFIEECAPSGIDRLKLASFGQTQDLRAFSNMLQSLMLMSQPKPCPFAQRIALSGSPHEDTDIYNAFSARNIDIVTEDHDWGAGIYANDIEEQCDPIVALEKHYRIHGISMRQFSKPQVGRNFSDKDKFHSGSNPEAVVFYFEENDDTLGWEYPDQKQRLNAMGIETALLRGPLEGTQYLASINALAAKLQANAGEQSNA